MEEDEVDVTCRMHGKKRNAYVEDVGVCGDIVCERHTIKVRKCGLE